MKIRLTTQDVINAGAKLRDEFDFDRCLIEIWLRTLCKNGYIEAADLDRIFDLIVG